MSIRKEIKKNIKVSAGPKKTEKSLLAPKQNQE